MNKHDIKKTMTKRKRWIACSNLGSPFFLIRTIFFLYITCQVYMFGWLFGIIANLIYLVLDWFFLHLHTDYLQFHNFYILILVLRKRRKYPKSMVIMIQLFFLFADCTTIQLKNIIIGDCFCTFYIVGCTNCKYKFF